MYTKLKEMSLLTAIIMSSGCGNKIISQTYDYRDRDIYFYEYMPAKESKTKLGIKCSVGSFDTSKLANSLFSINCAGLDFKYDLSELDEGIRYEVNRKLKESMLCYDSTMLNTKNSRFQIEGRLRTINIGSDSKSLCWGVDYFMDASIEYYIYDKTKEEIIFKDTAYINHELLKLSEYELYRNYGSIMIHKVTDLVTTELINKLSKSRWIEKIANSVPLSDVEEDLARSQRNSIIQNEKMRANLLVKTMNDRDRKGAEQFRRDMTQMISDFQTNTQRILATGKNNSSYYGYNQSAASSSYSYSSGSCDPNICVNDPTVAAWKSKSDLFNGANQTPQYCAAAALCKCFLDNNLYAEAGCKDANGAPTSTTKGQLQNLLDTNLNNASRLGTTCW